MKVWLIRVVNQIIPFVIARNTKTPQPLIQQ